MVLVLAGLLLIRLSGGDLSILGGVGGVVVVAVVDTGALLVSFEVL